MGDVQYSRCQKSPKRRGVAIEYAGRVGENIK